MEEIKLDIKFLLIAEDLTNVPFVVFLIFRKLGNTKYLPQMLAERFYANIRQELVQFFVSIRTRCCLTLR